MSAPEAVAVERLVKPATIVLPELTPHERRVKEMMAGFRQATPHKPTVADEKTRKLRGRLPLEEVLEFFDAAGIEVRIVGIPDGDTELVVDENFMKETNPAHFTFVQVRPPDLPRMMDALSDLSVVIAGGFVAFGVRMTPMLELTDANNLMKIARGKLDEHGKFQKPADHPVPRYEFALALQGYDPEADAAASFPAFVNPEALVQRATSVPPRVVASGLRANETLAHTGGHLFRVSLAGLPGVLYSGPLAFDALAGIGGGHADEWCAKLGLHLPDTIGRLVRVRAPTPMEAGPGTVYCEVEAK